MSKIFINLTSEAKNLYKLLTAIVYYVEGSFTTVSYMQKELSITKN